MTQFLACTAALVGAGLWRWLDPWSPENPFLALIASRSPIAYEMLWWVHVSC